MYSVTVAVIQELNWKEPQIINYQDPNTLIRQQLLISKRVDRPESASCITGCAVLQHNPATCCNLTPITLPKFIS